MTMASSLFEAHRFRETGTLGVLEAGEIILNAIKDY